MTSEKFQVHNCFPNLHPYKYVGWGEYQFGQTKEIVGTDGVFCSLAITLYDPSQKKGVLAHITGLSDSLQTMMPENIVDTLLEALGLTPESDLTLLEATLSGESDAIFIQRLMSSLVKPVLEKYGISIIGEDLGEIPAGIKSFMSFDASGRLVFLHCDTGLVEVFRA